MTLGSRVEAQDLQGVDVPENCVPVWGEDWEGNPVMRGLRPGVVFTLRGKFGEGFDTKGPQVSMCGKCSEILLADASHGMIMTTQRHHWDVHGESLAMLP